MSTSLKEYLKKYQSTSDETTKKKRKKKEKSKPNPVGNGVIVVDEDPVWQKPIIEEEEESADDEAPQIDEDIEVKRMRRLEAIRSRKPYNVISEDGSGWISISGQPKESNHDNKDSDLSPPRNRRPRSDTPPRDDDLSPPRQHHRRRLDTSSPESDDDLSPPRRRSVEDLSPPRRNRNQLRMVDDDSFPPRSKGSLDDLSPPRRNRNQLLTVDDDSSPPRSKGSLDDLSPPRRNRNQLRTVDDDSSPPRSKGSLDDLSPPRRNRNHLPTADDDYLSPPRGNRGSRDDLSPPRRKRNQSVEIDISPPRRRKESSSMKNEDLSPQRKKHQPSSTKETTKTGLLTAAEVKKEIDKKRKDEISRFASMDASISGKGAEAVFRDKDGRRIKKEDLLKAQMEEKPKEKKLEWGKGLTQKREAEAKLKELELEKDKPFARTRDDPDLDKMLKERVRFGDPMAHLIKRKNTETLLEDLGDDEKMKESGFIIPQTIPSHSWIKRGIDYPPNRYNIKPGRHWDGVDRSNGYEKEQFKRQSEKRATESEAYMWSVADM